MAPTVSSLPHIETELTRILYAKAELELKSKITDIFQSAPKNQDEIFSKQ
jgi:hypothetical protein